MILPASTAASSFNSRTREGCDKVVFSKPTIAELVSIHAPGRGATTNVCTIVPNVAEFQFTHPGGVRRLYKNISDKLFKVSIHAPGRGATSGW